MRAGTTRPQHGRQPPPPHPIEPVPQRPRTQGAPVSGTHEAAHRWLGLLSLSLGLLVIGLDTTILTVALPTLATSLEATTSQLQWFTDAYTLAFAALLLPSGVLGGRLGRKRVLVAGLLLFTAGLVLAVLADTSGGLVLARLVMGVGAAAIAPQALALVPLLFPRDQRPRAAALATATFALGLPLGPLIGGGLLNSFWWGSIFLINIPVLALALVGVVRYVPEARGPRVPLDVVGSVLALTGISALLYGIIEAPNRGWGDPLALLAIFTGVALLCALLLWLRQAPHPLVDLSPFRSAHFAWGTATVCVVMFVLLGILFVVPQFLQQVQGHDAMATGIRLMPMFVGVLFATVAAEKLVSRFGIKWVVAVGMLLWAIALILLGRLAADSTYAATALALAIAGVALALTLPTTFDAVLSSLPPDTAGAGSALANACRQVGAAAGIAVLGSVLNTVYRGELDDGAVPQLAGGSMDAVRDHLAGAEAAAAALPSGQGQAVLAAARDAFVSGMSAASLVGAGVAAVMSLLVVAMLPARGGDGASARADPGPDSGAGAQVHQ
ncbi:MFS transporter [Streptomyces sp. BA2]|uniref:MFS transporter n=1 Tax=Streptomyces sp. BA2 TaxID=436595 RepID=UPI0013217D13|nr:MFS transporter [Streptomyces sp. BA2]MWA14574.1 DHA2 family efflux MFS transporter permease subunit [Streptomyces sp. BA2]